MSCNDLKNLKEKIVQTLDQIGSAELLSKIALYELHIQYPDFYNRNDPASENSFAMFVSGLCLQNNIQNEYDPNPKEYFEFKNLLDDYFERFKLSLLELDVPSDQTDHIRFQSQLERLFNDSNPHLFQHQKLDIHEKIFLPLDDYFENIYGFCINTCKEFIKIILDVLTDRMIERYKSADQKYGEALKSYKNDVSIKNQTHDLENVASYYGIWAFLYDAKRTMMINIDEYCKNYNIPKKKSFMNFLNAVSCTIGDQHDKFDNPLSNNVLSVKPIIKIDDQSFLIVKPDFLFYNFDRILENLLHEEKQSQSPIWHKFCDLKSKYLENKTVEFFERIFPKKTMFTNIYYWQDGVKHETDLLIKYDNKIFIIESKSGNLPNYALQTGKTALKRRLKELMNKSAEQAITAKNYIIGQKNAKFWDVNKQNVLLEINSSETHYDFHFITMTSAYIGSIALNPKELEKVGFFKNHIYPTSMHIHHLDALTDMLKEPSYIIHYFEERERTQNENTLTSSSELDMMGYYMKNGNLKIPHPGNFSRISLAGFNDEIIDHYESNKPKPTFSIPKTLSKLILEIQDHHQLGFTKIISELLDLSYNMKIKIDETLEHQFTLLSKNIPKYVFIYNYGDTGFACITSTKNFVLRDYLIYIMNYHRKQFKNIKKWIVVGKNIKYQQFDTFIIDTTYD